MDLEVERAGDGADLPPYRIESARSSRSRCKTCRRPIQQGKLRIGVRIEGPFGPGFLWHHLTCAARRRIDDVEQAYAQRAWDEGLEVPPLQELRAQVQEAEQKKAEKPEPPYVERAKTGRSKCKNCGEGIEQGAWRVILARKVTFGNQVRVGPINVHPECVAAAMASDENATEAEGFADALRANSAVDAAEADEVLARIGELPR